MAPVSHLGLYTSSPGVPGTTPLSLALGVPPQEWPASNFLYSYSFTVTAESCIKSCKNKGNDHQPKKLWLFSKFSLSVPKEVYRWEYREHEYQC